MKISREEVRKVGLLARLALSAEEEQLLTEQMDKILQYMEKLNRLDTADVEPLAHAVDIVNAFREDKIVHQPSTEALLSNAPERQEKFFKVPKIIE